MSVHDLPGLNAVLNSTSALFLIAGLVFVRHKNIPAHRACMLAAFTASVLFLVGYLTYHFQAGTTRFDGEGAVRALYFTLLTSHTILAAVVPPLAIITLRRGLRMDVARHRKIARWTLPIWLYVSVTGVLVYLFLYQWFPAPRG